MPKNSYQWILSDVNIIRCRKTDITEFFLMLISDAGKTTTIEFYLIKFCLMVISSGAEKPELLKFLWCLYEQMQKNRYHRILSDVNIIRCRKTGIIEFCLMLISSDALERDIMEFSLMLISSDAANRCHWIWSDVNIVRGRKAAIIECHEMLTSSDAEKKLSWNSHCPYRYRTTAINEYSLMLILSDAGNRRHLNFVWC